ncbi:hypothetical protein G7054_g11304 [Neopestalotiopsis clavispora]|nr:hypothetical protein G7054_g11304 [Neopestalotiopsis clavispora]
MYRFCFTRSQIVSLSTSSNHMATIRVLKETLRQRADDFTAPSRLALSETQYVAGFDLLARASEWATDENFIPQLSKLLSTLFGSRTKISALEIGPGPESVLGHLPSEMRSKINKYTAFEPNTLYATRLEEWLCRRCEEEYPLPQLQSKPTIHKASFEVECHPASSTTTHTDEQDQKFDLVLFCHSMYGMRSKRTIVERAIRMLADDHAGGMVIVVHREGSLDLGGLVCHRTFLLPDGLVRVANDDVSLDSFSAFIVGFALPSAEAEKSVREQWRIVCRTLGHTSEDHPDLLVFSAPQEIVAFTKDATSLESLTSARSMTLVENAVKNRDARLRVPAAVVRPQTLQQLQDCVRWALEHRTSLTVIGGGHSTQCIWPNAVAVDLSAFDQVHILDAPQTGVDGPLPSNGLVIAEAGCNTGDIIRNSMASGLTVPLGARPSVGAGLWLQGGIGHLSRLHGLTCDAILGAVLVSVHNGQIHFVGHVPKAHVPAGAVRSDNEIDLLWSLKGAGTNFGIVVSVTFRASLAPSFLISDLSLADFDKRIAKQLDRNSSVDAYIFGVDEELFLGITLYESSEAGSETRAPLNLEKVLGPEQNAKVVDSVGLFDTEMYISSMHGGHGGGKTSSFKRCSFLKNIGATEIANVLNSAVKTRPSPLCYIHLLQGGGAVADVLASSSAFGCRDWDFACVITGVWLRNQDGTDISRSAKQWVYDVARSLLPSSSGVYGADLGPDPRDLVLASKAFGPNIPRLSHLKEKYDPCGVLEYACPLPKIPTVPKLIVLITGDSGAWKDYCAEIWAGLFNSLDNPKLKSASVSISDTIKSEYAVATGANLDRLLRDRIYKEQHRPALTKFFQKQVRQRPRLLVENFLDAVYRYYEADVLLITGMRDTAPVTTFSHLVPHTRLLDVRVEASVKTRIHRRCFTTDSVEAGVAVGEIFTADSTPLGYRPSLIFDNESPGTEAAELFAEHFLLRYFDEHFGQLAKMIRSVPGHPRPGITFRHVLGVSEQKGGLNLCAMLLEAEYRGDWTKVERIACCEAGGFIFASALATRVGVPMLLMRKASKLPPPIISIAKSASYISLSSRVASAESFIGMDRDASSDGKSVVIVDDVLATGQTLCAMTRLLMEGGVNAADITILVVAEFPVRRGRDFLRQHGFGTVQVRSLLVFGGS